GDCGAGGLRQALPLSLRGACGSMATALPPQTVRLPPLAQGVLMAKPALILLHGMLCDARVWEDLRAALEEDFTIRVPDLRGPDSFRAMAEGVLARAPARFHLAGHS